MSSLWKNAASILGYLVSSVFPDARDLGDVPIAGLLVEHLDLREFRHDRLEAARAALRAGMAERALRHHDRAFAVDRVDERLGDRGAHELVVGREEGMDVDRVERRDQRVHVDDRNAGVDHLVDRRGQRADAERLDGDEIPLLRGHVVDRRALLDGVELAVEPGHFDVEQLAPIFRRLLALGAPGRLQAGVGEGRLERLASHLPASLAIAAPISGLKPMPPNSAAAPPPSAAPRMSSRRECESNFVVLIVRSSHVSRSASEVCDDYHRRRDQ